MQKKSPKQTQTNKQTNKPPGLRMQPVRIMYMQGKDEMELNYDIMSNNFGLHASFIYILLLVMTNTF